MEKDTCNWFKVGEIIELLVNINPFKKGDICVVIETEKYSEYGYTIREVAGSETCPVRGCEMLPSNDRLY